MENSTQADTTVAPVKNAIRNPANPHHYMVLQPVTSRIRIRAGDVELADTTNALRVIEIGDIAYRPRVYVPESDLVANLDRLDKSTHCPLKGDASYLALAGTEVGWTYDTLDFAEALRGYVSFAAEDLSIQETTQGA